MSEVSIFPGSGIRITTATWHDLRELYQLEKLCFQVDAWPIIDILGVLTLPQVLRLKAVDDLSMVGFIAADLRRMQQTAWIATFAVLPDYRKSGIGSALLETCESLISLPRIRLSVRQSNHAAIQLYQNHAYQQVDLWRAYYKGGDDALIFEKILGASGL
ncbi:MAG: GNAT family N-acetyltransferase [Anaerolineales bacterium]|nr:GNAT family N-acetyltransferase [Anaerolineales bacterium]